MKIALITDTHWGVRNDGIAFLDNSKQFIDSIFFPTLEQEGISTICHLGDLVDRRKYININTARRLRQDFLDPISERNYDFHIIAGNHDTYYKNTNSVNALNELVRGQYPFHIYDQLPREVDFDGLIVLMMPWICDENRKLTLEKIRGTNAQVCFGHLVLAGFEMYRGSMVSHGDDASIFNKFDLVCSGHYHHKSSSGNIHYLGNHGEFTWSDYNDPKGFHIFDTETRNLKFVRNPYTIFEKIWYNDTNYTIEDIASHEYEKYKNKIIKVIVQNKTNPYWFDMFVDNLEKSGILELQVVEDHLNLNLEQDEDIVNEAEDTLTIFKNYIGQINTSDDIKQKIENTVHSLYAEALSVE